MSSPESEEADPDAGTGETEVAPPLDRVAFVLRSLKTQDELMTLRAVYGPRLIVIAAYSPKEKRTEHLAGQIESSRGTRDRTKWSHQPEELIERDEKEEQARGQDVSGTFHRADFFVRGWDRDVARGDIQRTFEILFGSPFRTPTRDEQGQYLAAGAALRSAEYGRQVGAAIATAGGSIISVGANEVPTVGGGSIGRRTARATATSKSVMWTPTGRSSMSLPASWLSASTLAHTNSSKRRTTTAPTSRLCSRLSAANAAVSCPRICGPAGSRISRNSAVPYMPSRFSARPASTAYGATQDRLLRPDGCDRPAFRDLFLQIGCSSESSKT